MYSLLCGWCHSLLIRWNRFYQLAPWRLMDDISYPLHILEDWFDANRFFTGIWAVRNKHHYLKLIHWVDFQRWAGKSPQIANPQIANLQIFMIFPQILNSQIFAIYCQLCRKTVVTFNCFYFILYIIESYHFMPIFVRRKSMYLLTCGSF